MGNADRPDLRLIVITDAEAARPRDVVDVVRACVAAGAPMIQLRDKNATARELFEQAQALLAVTAPAGARLIVNDRVDVALAAGADGAHLGPDDLPVAAARSIAPPGFLLGYSTDDPVTAVEAARAGADYIGCGAVFGTTSKPEAAGERIGVERLRQVAAASPIPVVAIGGIDTANAHVLRGSGAAGIAVIRAVMAALDPAAAVRQLLAALGDDA